MNGSVLIIFFFEFFFSCDVSGGGDEEREATFNCPQGRALNFLHRHLRCVFNPSVVLRNAF